MLANRYRVEALLGWGGLSVVFQAVDTLHSGSKRGAPALLAVKVVRDDLAPDIRQESVEILRWEAHLLRRMRHPALPRLAQIYQDQTTAWMARELVVGTPLSVHAGHMPCDPEHVRNWAVQICDLLSYLHTRSPAVICADLKPANLVLRPDGTLALIDLGAAHTRTQRPPRRPRPRYGTPGYAPPEQLGNWGIDERTDLFSLGVICYELLTGIDPTSAPLQFDLLHLDMVAPYYANALRWALALDPPKRPPTASALRAVLIPSAPCEPLDLGFGVHIRTQQDLMSTAIRHPNLVERALLSGALERWLSIHPEHALGTLLHDLRAAQRTAPTRQRAIDTFFSALAPSEGSPMLQCSPDKLDFGDMPLRAWRLWSQPQRLTLQNTARRPLRWELEAPIQVSADVRIMLEGRALRRVEGVLPPGARAEVELVATGRKGRCHGTLNLRCGVHITRIPWEGMAQPGLPIGQQFVVSMEQLDLSAPDLVPTLEELLQCGMLTRWLRSQGKRSLAAHLTEVLKKPTLTPLDLRLLVTHLLHPFDPRRFPLLLVHDAMPSNLLLTAGEVASHTIDVENVGMDACTLRWSSQVPWVHVPREHVVVQSGERHTCLVTLAPPGTLPEGRQQVSLELQVADLRFPVTFPVHVNVRQWWQRVWNWLRGS